MTEQDLPSSEVTTEELEKVASMLYHRKAQRISSMNIFPFRDRRKKLLDKWDDLGYGM